VAKHAGSASLDLHSIGVIRSSIVSRAEAPKQGYEGAPDAWLELVPEVGPGLEGIEAGDEIIVITWLDRGNRETLRVHPRGNPANPITGVFATRSPDRPNPIGLHRVRVHQREGLRLRVGPIEVLDGTPVVDLKPVLPDSADS
jgi:tRNA-Thr(GGU) m(6)t(6)A37 methyltransferase TsaA